MIIALLIDCNSIISVIESSSISILDFKIRLNNKNDDNTVIINIIISSIM